ncbi:hypothetical protein N7517_005795 [Penicillium concentricum]|uniref:Uncharacterized protein n=1 Tax=Penicillium concentricum TaxID=293559 RepID=A0A9W9SAW3_9EURO|nr:uncharacterized protein N7517_005795 [Penicillium concentricum]KAJ5373789.1 hypothetical protein N7517_005795 [Penicillium concentricum]
MCFGSSRREEVYDSPPTRRAYYGHGTHSQYTYNKDNAAHKKKKKRRAYQSTATASIIAAGASGGGGGGGC